MNKTTNNKPVVKVQPAKDAIVKTIASRDTPKVAPKKTVLVSKESVKDTIIKVQADQIQTLADMVRGLNTRVERVESQCEVLERIIVGLQKTQAQYSDDMAQPAPKVTQALADDSFETVLAQTALHVRENASENFFNEKIIAQTECDLRVYLKTAQNKTFKLARTAAGISLIDAVNALEVAVNG